MLRLCEPEVRTMLVEYYKDDLLVFSEIMPVSNKQEMYNTAESLGCNRIFHKMLWYQDALGTWMKTKHAIVWEVQGE